MQFRLKYPHNKTYLFFQYLYSVISFVTLPSDFSKKTNQLLKIVIYTNSLSFMKICQAVSARAVVPNLFRLMDPLVHRAKSYGPPPIYPPTNINGQFLLQERTAINYCKENKFNINIDDINIGVTVV